MSSLDKCADYAALKRGLAGADKAGIRELVSVASARSEEISLLTTVRDPRARPVLMYNLKHILEQRMPELIAQALERARGEAMDQAANAQRAAASALEQLTNEGKTDGASS